MSDEAMDRFRELCAEVSKRGHGLSLTELAAAHALAEEEHLERSDPDRARISRKTLGLVQ